MRRINPLTTSSSRGYLGLNNAPRHGHWQSHGHRLRHVKRQRHRGQDPTKLKTKPRLAKHHCRRFRHHHSSWRLYQTTTRWLTKAPDQNLA